MTRRSFANTQTTNRTSRMIPKHNRHSAGVVYNSPHDDEMHGDGLFSMAKSIFKHG